MKFTKYGVRYWFDTFTHLKPFDVLSSQEVVDLYLKNHELLGKDRPNVGGWSVKPIDSTKDPIKKDGFWSGYPPAYFNIDTTGKGVSQAKADVISMDLAGVGVKWDNFIYLELPAQFISIYQTKVHSNPSLEIFKQFIEEVRNSTTKRIMEIHKLYDERYPKPHEFQNFFRKVDDPGWRADLDVSQYISIRDSGLIYPICYPHKKYIYKRGTHRGWFCSMTNSDIPIFLQVPKPDWSGEDLDENNWNVKFEDNFTDSVSMNIDRDTKKLTFYLGDRKIGQF